MFACLNKHKVKRCNDCENMAMGLPAFAKKLASAASIKRSATAILLHNTDNLHEIKGK